MANDVTYTTKGGVEGIGSVITGKITDVAGSADIAVACGFIPSKVEVVSVGTSTLNHVVWYDSMGSAEALQIDEVVATAMLGAASIVPLAGTASTAPGFTLHSEILEAGTTYFAAHR